MPEDFDESLKRKLSANNSGGVVLNSAFGDWKDYISGNLRFRYAECGTRYLLNPDKELLALC